VGVVQDRICKITKGNLEKREGVGNTFVRKKGMALVRNGAGILLAGRVKVLG
jgi:hypothetical protein